MKLWMWGIVLLLAVAVAAASLLLTRSKPAAQNESKGTFEQLFSSTKSSTVREYEPASFGKPRNTFVIDLGSESENADSGDAYVFQVDENDHLVLDERTRLAVEKLYALNTPEELKEKLQKISNVLPLKAHLEMVDLIERFEKYTTTVKQILHPENESDKAPETVEDAFALLQEVHDLRVTLFGADNAAALFGKEETMNGQMLELMYKENKM